VARVGASWTFDGKTSTTVSYDWNPGANGWSRIQNGALHVDAGGRPVVPTNVIFQFVTYHDTGYVDSSGAHVPEADVVGSGDGWFLSAGYLVPVHWVKRDKEDVTEFRADDGRYARLLPGRTWVELVQVGRANATDRPADAGDAAKPVAPPPPANTGPTGQPTNTTVTTAPPSESTTTSTQPAASTTTTTQPSPVTTVTVPPVGGSSTTSSSSTSSSSTTSTTTSTTTAGGKSDKKGGGKDKPSSAAAVRAPSVTAARASSGVAAGPATAAVLGLLLLFAPVPDGRRRRPRARRRPH
jgi:hypothetical protein